MKLYIYDHCPFCVRARMILGLRGMAAEEIVLANDDEATPIGMIGAKQVPILQKDDGSYMAESLDIVRYIDGLQSGARLQESVRPEVAAWLERVGAYWNKLVQPRMVLIGLPEFATQSAIDYFVHKKEANIGSFAENLAKTEEYLPQLADDLAELSALLGDKAFFGGEAAGMEDIHLFPLLRNLTIVKDAVLPANLQAYVEKTAQASGVALYRDRAV